MTKLTDIMAFLGAMSDIDEIFDLPKFRPHLLGGNRTGVYSLHVSANWRITFKYDANKNELYDVDFEDYH